MTETIDPISVRAIVLVNIYSEDPRLGCSTLCLWRPPESGREKTTPPWAVMTAVMWLWDKYSHSSHICSDAKSQIFQEGEQRE